MDVDRAYRDRVLAACPSRRSFLRFLLGSPLLLCSQQVSAFQRFLDGAVQGEGSAEEAQQLIAAPADAINVFDFREVAEHSLAPAHYAYLATGVDQELTLKANIEGFTKFQLRPRRLRNLRDLDTSTEILGAKLSCPIILAPAAFQKTFHPEGEIAVARAAKRKDHLQILSTASSASLEEVIEARGAPIWLQLFTPRVWPITRWRLKQAEKAGCPAAVLTVDHVGCASRDRLRRFRRPDNANCQFCHKSNVEDLLRGVGRIASALGIDPMETISDLRSLDWDFVDRIRDATPMKLLIKGILTHEDASLCVEHGVDGIIVSNHGGRVVDSGLSTIEVLPEIVEAVAGRIPILIDSGFRRGTDFFKALALGASGVCVGRPYLWGLSAFGQEGVESVLAILRREFEATMRQMGTPTLEAITPAHLRVAGPARALSR